MHLLCQQRGCVSFTHSHTHTWPPTVDSGHTQTRWQKRTGVHRTVAQRKQLLPPLYMAPFNRLHIHWITTNVTRSAVKRTRVKRGGGIHPVGGDCSGCGWSRDGKRVKGSGQSSKTAHYKNSREKACQQYDWHVSVIWKKKPNGIKNDLAGASKKASFV